LMFRVECHLIQHCGFICLYVPMTVLDALG
jgi:hypothetical protein